MASGTQKVLGILIGTIVASIASYGLYHYISNAKVNSSAAPILSPTLNSLSLKQKLEIQGLLERLKTEISQLQNKRQKSGFPPFTWEQDKGLYGSAVRLNFHGSPEMSAIRDGFHVYDNNMFATTWITSCLLEAQLFGTGIKPSEDDINIAVKAIGQYVNRNLNYNNSLMTFWPQVYNQSAGSWQSTPGNLLELFDIVEKAPMKFVESLLKFLGLKQIEDVMEHLLREKDTFAKAFHIPADFDDTFVNLGLGSLLKETESEYPTAAEEWKRNNVNMSSAFDALRKYAYRPFSEDPKVNTIDPRTYFYQHKFLSENRKADLALVPTWVQNSEEAMSQDKAGVSMPFWVNNVDVTVATNTIFGITSAILGGILDEKEFDSKIQQIYLNTSSMIAYQMSSNFSSRKDLALTYYPSKFESYWFTSRTLALLRRHQTSIKKYPVMSSVLEMFSETLSGPVTQDIINSAQHTTSEAYFDDFLGDGDHSFGNKTEIRAEDRIFTTAMAVNTLIDTWTVFDRERKQLFWHSDVPSDVKQLLYGSITWLKENVLSYKYKKWNAFFSGSGKGLSSLPFWYPANRLEFMNGTSVNSSNIPAGVSFMIGFEGYVSEEDYQKMVQLPHFGRRTPVDFHGYNDPSDPEGFFPFWTSDAYTYSTVLVAMSKYINIHDDGQH